MAEFCICFNWCSSEEPQPKRHQRLDRSMIGEPMNFVHMAHVGTREIINGLASVGSIQDYMKSKGGYANDNSTNAQL
ncbi:CDC42 small effector protein 2-A [Alligator mississippiensis]|uniref:CDC42 small effector protein 2-A n=1 Tax=Alligator mississippiensis TaxID=8496 RepID=UPI0003D0B583|nr:CDC42 small effector protein 2-A [Alligator mississippiensis]XP_019333007.1 CDC42 small effector protein 2-A [Alligator mississippiensis]